MANNYSDPKVFGPKLWNRLHISARNAISDLQKRNFITYFYQEINNIPCETCRSRALEYIRQNPITINPIIRDPSGVDATVFHYTWTFHNLVNEHLNKPQLTWEQACSLYRVGQVLNEPVGQILNEPFIAKIPKSTDCCCGEKKKKKKKKKKHFKVIYV